MDQREIREARRGRRVEWELTWNPEYRLSLASYARRYYVSIS